jgi:osmotically-inducible protein OsmY
MKNATTKILLTTMFATSSSTAVANSMWQEDTLDAWIDGKAETTLLLNTNLNSFDINTHVNDQVITLTGSVDNDTEKMLAAELVEGIDNVKSVNNQLTVVSEDDQQSMEAIQLLTDAKITAVVKTRLLMNDAVSGADISVETQKQVVILKGDVESNIEHDLALTIAKNTSDVHKVVDELNITQ